MVKVIFTVGISASGKSSWAGEQCAHNPTKVGIVCRDWIRHQILSDRLGRDHPVYNSSKTPTNIWKVWKFGKDEKLVTEMWWAELESAIKWNETVIVADTNLNKDRLDNLIREVEAKFPDVETEIKLFPIELEEAIKRDNARADGVGAEIIFKQWLQYHEFIGSKKYTPIAGTRKAIMVDIDGTLAHQGDRGIFEWNKVGVDSLDMAVYHIVRGYYQQGYEIVIMSGRDSACRKETEEWLEKYNVPYTALFMRKQGDCRKDSIVKEELFWECVASHYSVELVVDDRPQVTQMWYRLGLKLAHVGCPWISF